MNMSNKLYGKEPTATSSFSGLECSFTMHPVSGIAAVLSYSKVRKQAQFEIAFAFFQGIVREPQTFSW